MSKLRLLAVSEQECAVEGCFLHSKVPLGGHGPAGT